MDPVLYQGTCYKVSGWTIRDAESREVIRAVRADAGRVAATPLPEPVCRDPDLVIAAALAANADAIVTGDRDLLVLKSFHGIPILNPATVSPDWQQIDGFTARRTAPFAPAQ